METEGQTNDCHFPVLSDEAFTTPPPQVSPSPPQTVLVFEPLLSSCLEFQGRKGLTFLTQAVMSENLV